MPSELLATVRVSQLPKWVAIAPDGSRAYATLDGQANPASGAVAVIDTQSNSLVTAIGVGPFPSGVVIAPDDSRAYISSSGTGGGPGLVNVIDTGAGAVIARVPVGTAGSRPSGIAITPSGSHLYVASSAGLADGPGTVNVIDTASGTVVAAIPGNPFPSTVTMTPDGAFAYVLDTEGNPQVIDTMTHESTFPLERVIDGTGRIAFAPDGLLAYVGGEGIGEIDVLDVGGNKVVGAIDVFGGLTTDLAVAPGGQRVYAAQRSGEAPIEGVRVIDTGGRKVTGSPITWSGSADGIAITPDGRRAYVSDRHSSAIQVIDLPAA